MPSKVKYLTHDQSDTLLSHIRHPRDRAIFTVAYWRGLRASEVGKLQLSDWSPDTRRLYVHRAKNGKSGEYIVSDPEAKAINKWLQDRGAWPGPLFPSERRTPISPRQLDHLMKRYCSEIAAKCTPPIEKSLWHMHVLRHSIAVHMVMGRFALQEIADWLGHRSLTSTMVYAEVVSTARDGVAKSMYRDRLGEDKPEVKWKRRKR